MNRDPILKAWFKQALSMASSRKRTKTVAAICDKFDYVPMLQRIKISKEGEENLNLTTKFEAAVKEILAGANDSSVAERYEINLETLREEIQRFRTSETSEYEYNKTGRIFSFKEELMLLEILATIPQSRCMCQTCTLERLPYLAYQVARHEGKSYPREWDKHQHAGKGWQTNFKIEYEYEISNSFPTECNKQKA